MLMLQDTFWRSWREVDVAGTVSYRSCTCHAPVGGPSASERDLGFVGCDLYHPVRVSQHHAKRAVVGSVMVSLTETGTGCEPRPRDRERHRLCRFRTTLN